jgi:hypothetical protein
MGVISDPFLGNGETGVLFARLRRDGVVVEVTVGKRS